MAFSHGQTEALTTSISMDASIRVICGRTPRLSACELVSFRPQGRADGPGPGEYSMIGGAAGVKRAHYRGSTARRSYQGAERDNQLDRGSHFVVAAESALPSAQVQRAGPRRFHVPDVEVSTSAPNALRLRYVAGSFLTSLGKIDD